jgi:C-3',4' desaturase CrtD
MRDVIIIGAGIAGMATALRLQAGGLRTLLLEAHGQPGGCAGFFRKRGFSFDVGATTLVDFEPGGVGGDLLATVGLPPLTGEALPGYVAWLPDRTVTLHRDHDRWARERLAMLGASPAHQALWALLDRVATAFWQASRRGIKLPLRSVNDVLTCVQAISLRDLPLARHLFATLGDALRWFNLRDDKPLASLLAMLTEDTVHSTLDAAPLINAALGITIRGAGLTRHVGGMWGFWQTLVSHYRSLGGELRVGCRVDRVEGAFGAFKVHTQRGLFESAQVVSAVPAQVTARLAPALIATPLRPYLERDAAAQGGAVVVFLGVPEAEVAGQAFTHHQLMQSYAAPLGNGNNMFVSVSAAGDTQSAPAGSRAVMISTHCDLEEWRGLTEADYLVQKRTIGEQLVGYARRVYPQLGEHAAVYEIGTPRTYERYTRRPDGAVGGFRLNVRNCNQFALPYDLGPRGFWLAGDTTWPGLGTVACVLASQHVAAGVSRLAQHLRRPSTVTVQPSA